MKKEAKSSEIWSSIERISRGGFGFEIFFKNGKIGQYAYGSGLLNPEIFTRNELTAIQWSIL